LLYRHLCHQHQQQIPDQYRYSPWEPKSAFRMRYTLSTKPYERNIAQQAGPKVTLVRYSVRISVEMPVMLIDVFRDIPKSQASISIWTRMLLSKILPNSKSSHHPTLYSLDTESRRITSKKSSVFKDIIGIEIWCFAHVRI
jgi:hypothetical protein